MVIKRELSAHYVESTARARAAFDHDEVSVVIDVDSPDDGPFATIACSGACTLASDNVEQLTGYQRRTAALRETKGRVD